MKVTVAGRKTATGGVADGRGKTVEVAARVEEVTDRRRPACNQGRNKGFGEGF